MSSPTISYQSILEYGLTETAVLITEGFSDYIIPLAVDLPTLMHMVSHDGLAAPLCRVLLTDDDGAGVGLIARRGWTSRVAAMSLKPSARGQGLGRRLLEQLITESRERGDRQLLLEVIEQNTPAVKLYERTGFQTVRRLISYSYTPEATGSPNPALTEVNLHDVARAVITHGWQDLPWQLSGESLALNGPPNRAYQLNNAYAVISNPDNDQIGIRSLVVEQAHQKQGQATQLLQALFAQFPDKRWRIPALCPEDADPLLTKIGFTHSKLSQLQMRLDL